MKYRMTRTASGGDVEIATDHACSVIIPKDNRRAMVRREKNGLVYCYGRMYWTVDGMIRLLQWARYIDPTTTYNDILMLNPHVLSPVDELRFYAELELLGIKWNE